MLSIISMASMILIVDTYNVLHVVGVLPPEIAGIETGDLLDMIPPSRYSTHRVELVCDGTPGEDAPQGRHGRIRVRYAGAGRQADDLIAALVAGSSAPKRITVVSSDQWVVRQARRRRCRTMSASEFLRQLVTDLRGRPALPRLQRPHGKLPESEVAKWLNVFNVATPPRENDDEPTTPIEQKQPPLDNQNQPVTTNEPPNCEQQHDHERIPEDIIEQAERIWAEGDG